MLFFLLICDSWNGIWKISSLRPDCLTKWVEQFRLGIAINRRFECSVFRGSVFRRDRTIRRDYSPPVHRKAQRRHWTVRLQLISKTLQGMVPHAQRAGEITGETLSGVRAPAESIGGSSLLNPELWTLNTRISWGDETTWFKVEANFKYVWLGLTHRKALIDDLSKSFSNQ